MSQKSVSQNVKKKCPQKLFQKKCPKNFPKNRCYCHIKWLILTKVVLTPSVLGSFVVLSSKFWGILGMWENDLPVFGVRVGFANPPHRGRSTLIYNRLPALCITFTFFIRLASLVRGSKNSLVPSLITVFSRLYLKISSIAMIQSQQSKNWADRYLW